MNPHHRRSARNVAVVGGGINGIMAATALRKRGFGVDVFEARETMGATSSASTKLLHGGLRYLEHGSFRLVREALNERSWWFLHAPHLCRPVELLLPVWEARGRPRWKLRAGLFLYDCLAGKSQPKRHQWLSATQALAKQPELSRRNLQGAFTFWDGQMDDFALGKWAAERAQELGVRLHENTKVMRLHQDGNVVFDGGTRKFDRVVNAAGPWASKLLELSSIPSAYSLDLVRGSHLVTSRPCAAGMLAEVRGERRIGFVLPWKGGSLVGTTEVRQASPQTEGCSPEEMLYIRAFYDSVIEVPMHDAEVISSFSGVRPLIRSSSPTDRATREYAIERAGSVITAFGGKWTTARKLGERIADEVSR